MQTRFNKSLANTDKNIPEDTIHNETISFVLSAHKEKMEKDTKGWLKFNFSLSLLCLIYYKVSDNKKEKDSLFHIDNIFLSVSVILCIVFGAPYL